MHRFRFFMARASALWFAAFLLLLTTLPAWAVTGTWTTAGSLATARYTHRGTLLPSGKVLVEGGRNGGGSLNSAELYDPATDTWSAAGTLLAKHELHTATQLLSGKVLVAGGFGGGPELYDPTNDSWSAAGGFPYVRYDHTATLLSSGNVLVVGGWSSGVGINSVVSYDPGTNAWTMAAPLAIPRYGHTATLLPSGQVLVVGGYYNGNYLNSAELYDPTTNTWDTAATLATARMYHTATPLSSGKVLVAGGYNINYLDSAELYDPATNTWSAAGTLLSARDEHSATLLSADRVLVVGGYRGSNKLDSAELYDSGTNTWTSAGTLATSHVYHTATLLPSGKVLVSGGTNGGALDSAELYDPTLSTYTVGGNVSGLAGNGLVLALNGSAQSLLVSANGTFSFPTALASGANYAVTVATQPSSPTQTCTVSNGSGMVGAANVSNVNVTCATNTYTVGGNVSGLAGNGLVLALNGSAQSLPVSANGTFSFPTALASGANYAVTVATQPSSLTQTCTVSNGSGMVGAANVNNVSVTCATNTYTVGGSASGVDVSGLVLQLNGGNDLAVNANGPFTFTTPIASGASYTATILSQPAARTCTLTDASGTVGASDITNVSVACTVNTYTVGGSASGLAGNGLVLALNGSAQSLPVSANGTFSFPAALASGANYAVTVATQPSSPTQTCTVSNGSGMVGAANVNNVSVICATNTYTVGGSASGVDVSGLVLQLNGGNDLAVNANGPFTFTTPIASGASYTATILSQPAARTCTLTDASGTVGASDITNVSVACTVNTYTVGGNVSGLAGNGLVLALNGSAQSLLVSANGTFSFPAALASGANYAVTVATQPSSPTQTCTVSNGSGMVGAANVSNVSVICTTNTYTIGGNVSGLAGNGLVLALNGSAQSLPVSANGTFSFPAALASGANYAVTVATQPSSPTQTCTVSNGSGMVGAANVSNVNVTCATNTYAVGGNVSGLAGNGLVLALNGSAQSLLVSANGTFSFPAALASGANYAVTVATQPSSPTQTCTVSNDSGMVGAANVSNVSVICTTNTYTIGGNVSGLAGNGLVLALNGSAQSLPVSANGAFSFPAALTSGANYAVTVATQPSSPTQTCTVSNGSGMVGTANVNNVSVACIALPQLALSVIDNREFARYGQIVDYAVTLANNGDGDASSVSVTFTLSAGFDGAAAQLTCNGAGSGATCTQDGTNSLLYHVTLPAHRSLSWLISVPVRADTPEATVQFSVGATGATSVTDTDTLVIFRDGFDVLNGDGTQALSIVEGTLARAILDGDALHEAWVPTTPSATTQPLLLVRDDARELRVDWRSMAGLEFVRLLERDADGHERATPWSLTQAGATLELGSEAIHDDAGVDTQEAASREVILVGATPPPSLRH